MLTRLRLRKLVGLAVIAVTLVGGGFAGPAQAGTTYTFTNAGQTGPTGPTQSQVNSAYTNTPLAGTVSVISGIQTWTVPFTGTYRITANGAQGGDFNAGAQGGQLGGRGAVIAGDFSLQQGDVLRILVGQRGGERSGTVANNGIGAGGGGTFVATSSNTPLVVAGGGGAAGQTNNTNSNASTSTSGRDGTDNTPGRGGINGGGGGAAMGGTAGNGGTPGGQGSSCSFGSGGGGFFSRGGHNCEGDAPQIGGQGFVNGGVGGAADTRNGGVPGGFGGGAGVGHRAPGGGGYSGGGGDQGIGGGGGGGSFNAGANQSNSLGQSGHGLVTMQLLQAPPSVTSAVPSSVTVSSASLGGNVTADGGLSVTARGVVWATTQNPALGGSGVTNISAGSGTGTFTVGLSGLSPGTTYYVRAYATNNMATSYGTQQSFTTLKLDQTVTFADVLPSSTFGDAPFTVSPTTDANGLTPSLSASPAAVCAVTGPNGEGAFTVTIVGGGDCTLTASQGGNTTYNAATPVTRSFTVARAAQAIDFPPVNDLPFAPTSRALSATTSSALAVIFASDTPTICTVSGADLTTLREGECTLVASQAGNDNFLPAAHVTRSFTVTLASQTVTLSDSPQRTYGDAPFAPTTVSSTGVGITPVLSSSTPAVCTTDGTTVTVVASGACALEASVAGDDRYLPASVQLQIAVARRELTLTGTVVTESRVYDGTTDAVVSEGTSLSLVGVLAQDVPDVSFNPVLVWADSRAGIHTVSVSGLSVVVGSRAEHYVLSFTGAPTVTATIHPRSLTVSGFAPITRPFDGTTAVDLPPCNTYELIGVLTGESVTLTCPSTGTTAAAAVGTHVVTPSLPYTLTGVHADNYTFTPPTINATITKALAQMWFTTGLVQVLQPGTVMAALPAATVNPITAGTLIMDWQDGAPPSAPGRYRVNLTLESQSHQAAPLATFVSVIAAQSLPQGMTPPTIGPRTPTDDDGEPVTPSLPPSEVTARKDDQPVTTNVTRPTDTDIQVADDQSQVVLTFTARGQAAGTARPLAAATDLTLLAGGVLDVTGSGFKPLTTVEVWMFSEPQLIGVVQADATGGFVTQFDVPRTVRAGEHVIQLNGITNQNLLGSFSLGVLVEVPASDAEPAPLRRANGRLLTATSRGPAVIIGQRPVVVRADVERNQRVLGVARDTLTLTREDRVDDWVARLSPQPNGQVGLVADRNLVLSNGATIDASIGGFAPFSSVFVWVLSEPRLLGRAITDGNGATQFRVILPQDLAYGRHTLQLVATTEEGQTLGISVGVWRIKDAKPFTDVQLDATHGAAIATLAANGDIAGFADKTFKPHRTLRAHHATHMLARIFDTPVMPAYTIGLGLTRGQAAVMLAKLFAATPHESVERMPFEDVTDPTQQAAVSALYAQGLVTGYANGRFRPDAMITRAQFVSMVAHAQQHLAGV